MSWGGWCPKGGWAEDFPDPPGLLNKYPNLRETPVSQPEQRTEWNVRDSDAILIIADRGGLSVSKGTGRAQEWADHYGKPLLVIDASRPDAAGANCGVAARATHPIWRAYDARHRRTARERSPWNLHEHAPGGGQRAGSLEQQSGCRCWPAVADRPPAAIGQHPPLHEPDRARRTAAQGTGSTWWARNCCFGDPLIAQAIASMAGEATARGPARCAGGRKFKNRSTRSSPRRLWRWSRRRARPGRGRETGW